MDTYNADAINRRDARLLAEYLDSLDELLTPRYNDNVNDCPCVHCAPYLHVPHGNGCSGYHCHGSCISDAPRKPWYLGPMGTAFLDEKASNGYRAWLFGHHAWRIPDLYFDDAPADCDWDNLFQHFRTEILARRDPKTPHGQSGRAPLAGVV